MQIRNETSRLSNLKVLMVVENLPVPFDRRVWQEANALKDAGAEVSVICPTGKGFEAKHELINGINVYRHDLPTEANSAIGYLWEYSAALWAQFTLASKVYFKSGVNVIHGCNPPDLIFLVALPFKLLGVKYVFDHHDINPELYEAKFGKRGAFWTLMVLFERLTFMTANLSIATNESYRTIAIERGKKDPNKVHVVRSGPDLNKIRRVPVNNQLKNGRPYMVGYVGVIGAQEGLDLLIESIHHVIYNRNRTDIQFCIVGSGPSLQDIKTLASQRGVADYVSFLGRVPDALLLEVLSTADVCVNPDRVNPMNDKSTMNKILEYMAVGAPIVQYDVTEGRFSAQEASLYAKPNDSQDFGDKIIELIEAPDRRKIMGDYGYRRVAEHLSWEVERPKLVDAYTTLIRQK
jgi:glycosyltransferase involved in cell wall biosynthesis